MSVFDELVGQPAAVEALKAAAAAARRIRANAATGTNATGASDAAVGSGVGNETDASNSAMSQAWLFTGPPGSGRSIAARTLAAALECTGPEPGCGECSACTAVMDDNHPDVDSISTEGVTITVAQTRDLVARSHLAPGAPWRVFIIEDADRMAERTTNVLLKAIEEPGPRTVWMLCTPSPADVLTTIRSRCRNVALVTPGAEDVAGLIMARDGVNHDVALLAAQAAQSHVGMARALATDVRMRTRRSDSLKLAASIRGVGDAVIAAQRLFDTAKASADEQSEERNAQEREELLRDLGVDDAARIPPSVRSQIKDLEDQQKRRGTRALRDVLDRELVDMLSLYRDVLVRQLGADVALVNSDFSDDVARLASAATVEQTIARMDALAKARERIDANVTPLLALEAAMVALRPLAP